MCRCFFLLKVLVLAVGVLLGGWSSAISAWVAVVMVVVVVCCAACGDITFGTSGDVDGEYGSNNGIVAVFVAVVLVWSVVVKVIVRV